MWTEAQGQTIGKIIWEYRSNPANAEHRLTSDVEELEAGDVMLFVRLNRGATHRARFTIAPDGTYKRI